jgi:hypothetical protein
MEMGFFIAFQYVSVSMAAALHLRSISILTFMNIFTAHMILLRCLGIMFLWRLNEPDLKMFRITHRFLGKYLFLSLISTFVCDDAMNLQEYV